MLARTLDLEGGGFGVPHRLEKETSVSEDAEPRREVDCKIPHRLGRRTSILCKSVGTSLNQESLEGKIKKGQYLLAVDLSCSVGTSTTTITEDSRFETKKTKCIKGV